MNPFFSFLFIAGRFKLYQKQIPIEIRYNNSASFLNALFSFPTIFIIIIVKNMLFQQLPLILQ